jgi:WD40 repeat protein
MRKLTIIIVMSVLLSGLVQADNRALKIKLQEMRMEKRVALIIGNGHYKSSPLSNPVNDARLITESLENIGFEVISVENASQRQMKQAIDEFGRKIKNGGIGMFYYAGHGMQVNGRNYLIPVKANIQSEQDVEYESVDVGRVLAKMESANNRLNIVMLDACRNNPFARSFRSGTKGLATVDAPRGTFIAYATAPGSVASDGDSGNGLFTQEFVDIIQIPGLKIEDVFKMVRTRVRERSQGAQIPWQSSSLEGDLYFNLPKSMEGKSQSAPENIQLNSDMIFWNSIKDSNEIVQFREYLNKYPDGIYASLARIKINVLNKGKADAEVIDINFMPMKENRFNTNYPINNVYALANDRVLLLGRNDAEIIETENSKVINKFLFPKGVVSCSIGRKSNMIAFAVGPKEIWIYTKHELYKTISPRRGRISTISFGNNDNLLAVGFSDGHIEIWNVRLGEQEALLKGHSKRIHSLAFTSDDRQIVSGGDDLLIKYWDIALRKEARSFKEPMHQLSITRLSSDGSLIAIVAKVIHIDTMRNRRTDERFLIIRETETGKEIRKFRLAEDILSVNFHRNKRYIATASEDGAIKIWDIKEGTEVVNMPNDAVAKSLSFSENGKYLVFSQNQSATLIKLY